MTTDMDTATGTEMNNKSGFLSIPGGLLISCFSLGALAQQSIPGSAISGGLSGPSGLLTTASPLPADDIAASNIRSLVIKPRITLTETWSDNVAISKGQYNGKESGLITELAPGIRIDANTPRLKAYFDYALRGQFYTTGGNRTQNALNTFGTLEALSNWLFLDFSGVIAQQAISAFAPPPTSNSNLNNNSTETATYRISPFIRGQLGGTVDYLLRYNRSTTQSSASGVSDIELSEVAGQLRGSTPFQNLKWSVDLTQQTADYTRGRKTDADRLSAMVTYTVVPQFRVSLSAGQESNNYASATQENHNTYGYGFDWSPTERTQISAFKERRFFGDGHRLNITHRFPLSSIAYSDTRDVSVLPNQFMTAGLGTVFELWQQVCKQYYANTISDPAELDLKANQCAEDNIPKGISPNQQVLGSFLSSRATIQRRQQLALALQGARNTLTLLINRNESQSILASSAVNDDFALNNINNIRQRGFSVNLSHKLSAVSTLNMLASRQESSSSGTSSLKATTMMYQANLTSKLSEKTTGGISIRHTEFDSTANPYSENALIGTISVLF